MPRCIATFTDSAGVRRERVRSCAGGPGIPAHTRLVTFGDGIPCVPCSCGCVENKGCIGPGFSDGFAITGFYHAPLGGSGNTWTALTVVPVTCCCPGPATTPAGAALIAGKKLRARIVETTRLNLAAGGCPAGTIVNFVDTAIEVDGTAATTTRIEGTQAAGCGLNTTSQVTQTSHSGGATCNPVGPLPQHIEGPLPPEVFGKNFGPAGVVPFWHPPLPPSGTTVVAAEGVFRQGCTYNQTFFRYFTANNLVVEFTAEVSLFPNAEACTGPGCLSGCCIGETCIDTPSPVQCLALGGIPLDRPCLFGGCGPDPTKGACCTIVTGACSQVPPASCVSPNIFHGLGTTCESLPRPGCPQPLGRCCIPAGSGYSCLHGMTAKACAAQGGLFAPGHTCGSSPCPGQGGGACCKPDGTCDQVGNPQECIALNGVFFPGGNCGATQCTGSCCTSGVCEIKSSQACVGGGGVYVGGISCDPDPCNVVGACCIQTSHGMTCNQMTQTACSGSLGTFFPGLPCNPSPCGGTTEAPLLEAAAFQARLMGALGLGGGRGFSRGLVLPDGTPVGGVGVARGIVVVGGGGGCAGCGDESAKFTL